MNTIKISAFSLSTDKKLREYTLEELIEQLNYSTELQDFNIDSVYFEINTKEV